MHEIHALAPILSFWTNLYEILAPRLKAFWILVPATCEQFYGSKITFLSNLHRAHVTRRLLLGRVGSRPRPRALNNFCSEKLEICHHRCLDYRRTIFSPRRITQTDILVTWIRMQLTSGQWPERWGDSERLWCQKSTCCDLYTKCRLGGWTRMTSPHGELSAPLEEGSTESIDPSNPFVHKLHLGALQVRFSFFL